MKKKTKPQQRRQHVKQPTKKTKPQQKRNVKQKPPDVLFGNIQDEIKKLVEEWQPRKTLEVMTTDLFIRNMQFLDAKDKIKRFLAYRHLAEVAHGHFAEIHTEAETKEKYARLQRQKADPCKTDPHVNAWWIRSMLAKFNFGPISDNHDERFKPVSKKRGGKLAAKKLAEENPDKLKKLFLKKILEVEDMAEAMLYIDPQSLFYLIDVMKKDIITAAKYFPLCASYILQSAINDTHAFIKMSNDGYAFDGYTIGGDASGEIYLPWLRSYWHDYSGFEDVAEHLKLSGPQLNKTSRSHLYASATQCAANCIMIIGEIKKRKYYTLSNSRIETQGAQNVLDKFKAYILACENLPDLDKRENTIEKWWKVIKPMVEKVYEHPAYGDEKYWENLGRYTSKQSSEKKCKRHKKVDVWRKACKQALEGLAPNTPEK